MGLKNIVKKGVSLGFQPKRWLGVDQVTAQGKTCLNLVKDLFEPPVAPEIQAQLAAEAAALHQDQEAMSTRARLAVTLSSGYGLTGVAGLVYALFLLLSKALFLPAAVMCMVSFILFVYALREFMVYGQIRFGGKRLPLKSLLQKIILNRKASS